VREHFGQGKGKVRPSQNGVTKQNVNAKEKGHRKKIEKFRKGEEPWGGR